MTTDQTTRSAELAAAWTISHRETDEFNADQVAARRAIVRELVEGMGLSHTEAGRVLGISRSRIGRIMEAAGK